ncbi:MAG: lipopolysaccharide export system ATP-binding protein, partial [Myxococcota bacterium]
PLQARRAGPDELEALIARVGLGHVADSLAGRLSGGERRRLEIARCLASAPKVLLLDEPFAGVDPVAVADLQAEIRALAAGGIGILVTDHAVRETLGICHRAVIIDGGEVIAEGVPAEVTSDPRVRGRYLGEGFTLG